MTHTYTFSYTTDNRTINHEFSLEDIPQWQVLSDYFHNFLKANGYVFDYDVSLRVVKNEQEEEDSIYAEKAA